MDSNKIKSLAFGARDALRAEVSARIGKVLAEDSPERLDQPDKVGMLEAAISDKGIDAVVESSAYTWFNRLCALRFMDARGYTPVPVVTPRDGATQPAILADATQGVFDPDFGFSRLTRDRVQSVLAGGSAGGSNRTEAAYGELLIAVCDHYAEAMPYLFGEAVASSFAMPQGLLAEGSILRRIVEDMDDEACESVEVLGWLYQFYVAERKDEFNAGNRKATADDIAPATQLFTPNWIVRYLVENSLGRLWMLNNPGSQLVDKMDYYIAPEGETEDFIKISSPNSPEKITLCDPACGSGHILVYAFDLLYEIYLEEGYFPEDIPAHILEKNLFGMEIDGRAAEIAKFALEMKAREKDPGFFDKHIDANVTVLEAVKFEPGELADAGSIAGATELLDVFEHMTEVGSLYVPKPGDAAVVDDAIRNMEGAAGGMLEAKTLGKLQAMKHVLEALLRRFDCVVANPPYLGRSKFDSFMSDWTGINYSNEKSDLCTCFIKRGFSLSKDKGYSSMLTMQSWMTLGSFESMRKEIIENRAIAAMCHLGPRAFDQIGGEVVQVVATIFVNLASQLTGSYIRLVEAASSAKKAALLLSVANGDSNECLHRIKISAFADIPSYSFEAYHAKSSVVQGFRDGRPVGSIIKLKTGLVTGDNQQFARLWWEPKISNLEMHASDLRSAAESGTRWFPMQKGGSFKRWYGNNSYVVDWENDGFALKNHGVKSTSIRNTQYYFKQGIAWNEVSTGSLCVRFVEEGQIPNVSGPMGYGKSRNDLLFAMAFLNSSVAMSFLRLTAPTFHFSEGPLGTTPIMETDEGNKRSAEDMAERNVLICKSDYDAFETSWDFIAAPLVQTDEPYISNQFDRWSAECNQRFSQLKANEEELNRIFARIYDMEGEVPIEVPDNKVSVRRADLGRDIRALISYGVGCLMGRYSVYEPGLILADAGQTLADFEAKVPSADFKPDEDAILPVLDGEWFADDIVAQFRKWLEMTYGKETLEENVAFIENALGKDLRKYFVKDFYKDHCATYQVTGSGKRPIYWMFASPKGNFQALVYMHRYTPSTVGQILTKYLREYIDKLNASISALEQSDRAADRRQADKYRSVVTELTDWERDVMYPLANERVEIDLDDGVKVNYNKFPHALAKVAGLSTWK